VNNIKKNTVYYPGPTAHMPAGTLYMCVGSGMQKVKSYCVEVYEIAHRRPKGFFCYLCCATCNKINDCPHVCLRCSEEFKEPVATWVKEITKGMADDSGSFAGIQIEFEGTMTRGAPDHFERAVLYFYNVKTDELLHIDLNDIQDVNILWDTST